jgi:hypothetical protein
VRRRTTSFLAVALAAAIVTPLAFAATVNDYKKLILKSGKQSVQATVGFRCVPTPQGPDCPSEGQPTYPLKTTGTLKLKRGDEITLLFGAPVGNVTWWAARINGLGKEAPTAHGAAKVISKKVKKRWRIILPKNLKTTTKILGIYAESPNAQASFEVGVQIRK